MGYKKDGFGLFAQFEATEKDSGTWIKGDVIARTILTPLGELLDRVSYIAIDLGEGKKIASRAALLEQASAWRYQVIELADTTSFLDTDCKVHLRNEADGVKLSVGIGGAVLERLRPKLLDLATAWVLAWSKGLAPAQLLTYGSFHASADYPRPVPPARSSLVRFGSLVQFAGIKWHGAHEDGAPLLEALRKAPLPPGATRKVEGDVLVIRFIEDLGDPAAIREARAAQERWVVPLGKTEPEPGWNEHGDRIVIPDEAKPHEPLTLYDPEPEVGYKAITVQKGGVVDAKTWKAMAAVAKKKALPDGTSVRSLRLIVPKRKNALEIYDRAMADGFEMVIYPVGKAFWEVNPK